MSSLLVITIGQSPRPDIAGELADVLGDRPLEVVGVLDGLVRSDIERLAPVDDADVLHTRLAGQHDVIVSKRAVTERLRDLLETNAGRPTLVACTGRFAGLSGQPNVLFPSVVLEGLVDAVLPSGGRLGLLVPLPEQVAPMAEAWRRSDRPVTGVAVLPGSDPSRATADLVRAEVELVVLDCFGYDRTLLDTVRRTTGKPVLSAVRLTAHLAAELLG
ncbi:MAG: protein AroM [Acidimicrobiales bacterium]